MKRTENAALVGKHAFEIAGLGLAPFRFVGASENVITYPDGRQQAGGSCDYCGTGIRTECHVKSSDGKTFKVGCNCIDKVGDTGLLKAYKTSPEYRAKQRALRAIKSAAGLAEFKETIAAGADKLAALPHPMGFTDRKTGFPLTALDYAKWMLQNCGDASRRSVLNRLKAMLA